MGDNFLQTHQSPEDEWLSQFIEDSYSQSYACPGAIPFRMPIRTKKISTVEEIGENEIESALELEPANEIEPELTSELEPAKKRIIFKNIIGSKDSKGCCTHCSAAWSVQWREGPMGRATLCNACGIQYKKGRLVPEYRPAASPTFSEAEHSNFRKKVMELRKQKEGIEEDE